MLPEMTLEKLMEELETISPYIGRNLTTEIVNDHFIPRRQVILTVCVTGKGSAIKMAQLIENNLPSIQDNNVELIPINTKEITKEIEKIQNELKEILAIVGTIDVESNLPFIPIDEIILGDGLEKLNKIILESDCSLETDKYYDIFGFSEKIYIDLLSRFLNFISPDKAYYIARHTLEDICGILNIEVDEGIELGYIIHVSCMLERMLLGDFFQYEEIDSLIGDEKKTYQAIKQAMELIEDVFGVEVPDTEIGYIIDLINTQSNTLENNDAGSKSLGDG